MPLIQTGPRVVVSVIATGGGDWQVASTPTGFQGITSALFADNDYIHGFVRFENGVDWEEYDTDDETSTNLLQIANVTGTVTITRPAVPYASSNGGARVVDTTGTHTMAISLGSGTMKRIFREINGSWKTLTSGDATPDVADYRLFTTAGTTTITAFDSMEDGKVFIVKRGASDISIADGANISLPNDEQITLTTSNPAALFVEDSGVAYLVAMFGQEVLDEDDFASDSATKPPSQQSVGAYVAQAPNITAATELTIATGAITPTLAVHTIDTEADAASDDLTTITATNFSAGGLLAISAANGSRDVVIKASGGNILLPNDIDITLDDTEKTVILRFDGSNWNYVAGAGSGGTRSILATSVNSAATYTLFNAATAGKRYRAVVVDTTDNTTSGEIIVWAGSTPVVDVVSETVGVLEFGNSTTSIFFTNLSGSTQAYNVFIEELF